ncbi:unnamed protein product [Mycena citricolor]|uniref:Peroxisomal biogenesis factor 11 n=1 Tax=Mycena citricolor TaxID=2018698 RepID=A0AAD2GXL6_9AGAR|nr:unnamed protein product [Mycena citricolor]CAK5280574.1 unnamed protein product [Mycena citricolor]
MASIASQLVLHPSVSRALKLGSTTLGRDKLYRAVQNFARAYSWVLALRGHKEDSARWNAMKSHLAIARKLLRLGKPMEHLQAALKATISADPPIEQILAVARQLAYFSYLAFDMLTWAHTIKFLSLESSAAAKILRVANRSWLAGILFGITHAAVKTARLSREAKLLKHQQFSEKDVGSKMDGQSRLQAISKTKDAVRHQFIMDALDVWTPATNLGWSSMNDGFVGTFAMISSLMALQKQWEAVGGTK